MPIKTVIRIWENAEFTNNIGVVELEPPINIPLDDLVFSIRTWRSIDLSQSQAGSAGEVVVPSMATAPDFTAISAIARGSSVPAERSVLAVSGSPLPEGPATVALVFKQPAIMPSNASPMIGWHPGGASQRFGLITNSSGAYLCWSGAPTTSDSVAIPPVGGERWEMLFGMRDDDSGLISLYRPRTSSLVQAECTNFAGLNQAARILNHELYSTLSQGWEGAWGAMWARALSVEEMDDIYSSVQVSLLNSQILI